MVTQKKIPSNQESLEEKLERNILPIDVTEVDIKTPPVCSRIGAILDDEQSGLEEDS